MGERAELNGEGTPLKESLVHQWFRRIWTEGELGAVEELMHSDNLSVGLVNDPISIESFKAAYSSFDRLIANIRVDVGDVLEVGNKISGNWTLRGVHRKSGRPIEIPGALTGVTKGGKFLQCTNFVDYLDLFVQTGDLPEDILVRCMEEKYTGLMVGATFSDLTRAWSSDKTRFEALFESSVAALVVVKEDDRIVRFNRTFQRLFDLESEESLVKFQQLVHPVDQFQERALFEALYTKRCERYQIEIRLVLCDAVRWVQLTTQVLGDTPNGLVYLRSVEDITASRLEKMVQFQEQERRLLATDLHDAIAQDLALLLMLIQTAEALIGEEKIKDLLASALKQGQRISQELSIMMRDLRSPIVEGRPLETAVMELASDLSDATCRIKALTRIEGEISSGLVSHFAYRIIQEAIHNAKRHGKADSITISLNLRLGRLNGRITDNGIGFDPKSIEGPGNGLPGMIERCELLGGRLNVESEPGRGTGIWFELPLS